MLLCATTVLSASCGARTPEISLVLSVALTLSYISRMRYAKNARLQKILQTRQIDVTATHDTTDLCALVEDDAAGEQRRD